MRPIDWKREDRSHGLRLVKVEESHTGRDRNRPQITTKVSDIVTDDRLGSRITVRTGLRRDAARFGGTITTHTPKERVVPASPSVLAVPTWPAPDSSRDGRQPLHGLYEYSLRST